MVLDARERARRIADGRQRRSRDARGLTLIDDPGLLAEVAGMAEWPVALLGDIDPALPRTAAGGDPHRMRTHQRYFAVRDASGRPGPALHRRRQPGERRTAAR